MRINRIERIDFHIEPIDLRFLLYPGLLWFWRERWKLQSGARLLWGGQRSLRLCVASMYFSNDANNLVLKPVENMIKRVEAIRDFTKMLLAAHGRPNLGDFQLKLNIFNWIWINSVLKLLLHGTRIRINYCPPGNIGNMSFFMYFYKKRCAPKFHAEPTDRWAEISHMRPIQGQKLKLFEVLIYVICIVYCTFVVNRSIRSIRNNCP